jgi:tRNA(fMet)-specific endonuclease VapC
VDLSVDSSRAVSTAASNTPAVSTVSVFELAEGAHPSDRTESELQTIVDMPLSFPCVPIDGEVALLAGELSAELIGRGERIDVEDVLIGATALQADTAVLTRNVDHFERIPGVTVESY